MHWKPLHAYFFQICISIQYIFKFIMVLTHGINIRLGASKLFSLCFVWFWALDISAPTSYNIVCWWVGKKTFSFCYQHDSSFHVRSGHREHIIHDCYRFMPKKMYKKLSRCLFEKWEAALRKGCNQRSRPNLAR